jgi:S-formylglutathione hydrolase
MRTLSEHASFGGVQGFYAHDSRECGCEMRFSLYRPPRPRAVLYYLAGLTCTEETFVTKADALEHAARHGIVLVAPDTSPRVQLPGDRDSWDFGIAAGFYLNATQSPWAPHYRMDSYVVDELPAVIATNFNVDPQRSGIMGHSMGGHGALTIGLKNPQKYRSLSAFAPIVAPMQVPWGVKAFTGYLGENRAAWADYDACELLANGRRFPDIILVDQGLSDKFLEMQLKPELLEAAAKAAGQRLELRMHRGYDHGYFFIQTFMRDHVDWHARRLLPQ